MDEDLKKSQIKEFHLKFARSLRAEPEIMELLQQTADDLTRMWLVLCLVDGMDQDLVGKLAGINISKIQIERNEYLKEKYMKSDVLFRKVENLKKEVADELQESRTVRKSIEQGLEEALKQQMKAQEELIASKDDMIGILRRQVVDLERKQRKVTTEQSPQNQKEQNETLQKGQSQVQEAVDSAGTASRMERRSETMEGTMISGMELQWRPEPKQSIRRMLAYKRKTTDAKKFIEEFIQNDQMNEEQKEYLLQCLEEGLTVREIEMFASADLSVDIMRRLRRYYEQHTKNNGKR